MAAPNKRVRSTALWAVLALFGIMMVASLTTASGIDPGASTMQDDEADPNRVLTFEQPILYMYGDDSEGDRTQWTTWNHAESNDGQSATSSLRGIYLVMPMQEEELENSHLMALMPMKMQQELMLNNLLLAP
jgi:hypothetical protein